MAKKNETATKSVTVSAISAAEAKIAELRAAKAAEALAKSTAAPLPSLQ